MKKISTLLAFVSLSLTAAAANFSNETVVELASFEVRSARFSEAEKRIEVSLAELRNQARPIGRIRTELPSLGTVADQASQSDASRTVAAKPARRDAVRS